MPSGADTPPVTGFTGAEDLETACLLSDYQFHAAR